jgi:hypothetical protein
MADELNDEELKRLKREAAIRAKESDFYKKKQEEEDNKRQHLEELKAEYERQEETRREERLRVLKRQTEIRAQKKAAVDKLNRRREEKIAARQADWTERATVKIQQIVNEHEAQTDEVGQAAQDARDRKNACEAMAAAERLKAKEHQQDLEAKRKANLEQRELQTELRGIARSDAIKAEAQEELQSFIHHPYPVPLKQVLAGRLRPVPRVTELLSAYKDQREGLYDLEHENIALRAIIRNESLFQHVLGIQKDFEAHRIKPPEPIANDILKGRGRSPQKKRASDAGVMSNTGMSWKSSSNSPSRNKSMARATR